MRIHRIGNAVAEDHQHIPGLRADLHRLVTGSGNPELAISILRCCPSHTAYTTETYCASIGRPLSDPLSACSISAARGSATACERKKPLTSAAYSAAAEPFPLTSPTAIAVRPGEAAGES